MLSFPKQTVPVICLPTPVLEARATAAQQGSRSPVLVDTYRVHRLIGPISSESKWAESWGEQESG